MIEKFEHLGEWWLPNNPEVKIKGTLIFDPSGSSRLNLYGIFRYTHNSPKPEFYDTIVGKTASGKKITLLEATQFTTNWGGGFQQCTIKASKILLGAHFETKDSVKFKQLSVSFTNLHDWVNTNSIKITHPNKDSKDILINYNEPTLCKAKVNDQITINLCSSSTFSQNVDKVSLTEEIFFSLKSVNEIKLEEMLLYVFNLENLLSLAIRKVVYPKFIIGISDSCVIEFENNIIHEHVEVFYNLFNEPNELKYTPPSRMLFSYNDIEKQFEKIVSTWFAKSEQLQSVYNVFFNSRFGVKMYLNLRFLSLIYVLECYHRNSYGGLFMDKESFTEEIYVPLIASLSSKIKGSFRDSIKSKLKYLNEYSLNKRLKEILKKHDYVLSYFIKKKIEFIADVVDTRNYYTHFSSELFKKKKSGNELYWLAKLLELIIEVCLLDELGFSQSEILEQLTKFGMDKELKSIY